LCKEEELGSFDKLAYYHLDANKIFKNYLKELDLSPQEMSPQEFEILVVDCLKDLLKAKNSEDSLKLGKNPDSIMLFKAASVAIEVALPELLYSWLFRLDRYSDINRLF
jgi:hypothetical protein